MTRSLREQLLGRPRPTLQCPIAVADTAAAERAATEAQAELQLLVLTGEADAAAEARQRLQEAKTALEACFQPVTLTALPPDEFEALADAHPPREGTDDEAWNVDTFPRACFLACAPTDLSTQEWETFLSERVNDGERARLYGTALAVNVRTVDPTVPKDWTGMLS